MKFKSLVLFTFLLLHFFSYATKPILLTDSTEEFWVSKEYVDFFIDSTSSLQLTDIISVHDKDFKNSTHNIKNKKPEASYWIRFDIHTTAKARSFRLELFDFDIDEIELYTPSGFGEYILQKEGYNLPFHSRKINHKNPGFTISLKQNQNVRYYMRFKSRRNNNIFNPVIRSYEKAMSYSLQEYLFLGVFYGLLLLMIFYNGLYFIMLRRFHYLFYVIYAVSILVFIMNRNGTAFQYLWPSSPEINPHTEIVCLFTATLSMLLFTIYFLVINVMI